VGFFCIEEMADLSLFINTGTAIIKVTREIQQKKNKLIVDKCR